MEGYTTVKKYGSSEYEDRKSLFIGEALPVSTEAEALEFLESVKKRYPDARHHVYAYVLRENSTMRFSDDREPQGTAGMPVLDAIRKNGCTDVVIVVTRYFGGTLLGTGGLVRAYTAAAIGAIETAEIIRYDIYNTAELTVTYSDFQKLSPVIAQHGFRVNDTLYAENVTVVGSIIKTELDKFSEAVTEVTSGRAVLSVTDEKFEY